MQTLILGGSTFVGRRLVDLLVRQGHEVTVLNRGRTTSDLPPGVQRIVGDRTSTESMTQALAGTQWDSVIDVSGFVMAAGGGQFEDLIGLLDTNVGAYVFVSSIMAYAPTGLMPWTEDQPLRDEPQTTYGGFKAHAEQVILERHTVTGFPGTIARPAAIYGPDNNILDMEAAMFLRLRRQLPILVPHGGLVTGSYGHVDDLCINLVELAMQPAAFGQVVNTTGQGCSSAEYVAQLANIVGVEPRVVMVPDGFDASGPLFGHLFKERHHGILSLDRAHALGLTRERGFHIGHEQAYDWFCTSPLIDAPDAMADPMWGAGYDFALEASAAQRLGA